MSNAKQNTLDVLTQEIAILEALLTQAESYRNDTYAMFEKAQAIVSTIKKTKRDTIKKYNQLINS